MAYWRYIDAAGKTIIEEAPGIAGATPATKAEFDLAHPAPTPAVSEARKLAILLRSKGVLTLAELGSL